MAIRKFSTMKNIVITRNFIAKWQIKGFENYVFTTDGKCFNLRTNREIRQIMKGSTIGYVIGSKFRSVNQLRKSLELIKDGIKLPF